MSYPWPKLLRRKSTDKEPRRSFYHGYGLVGIGCDLVVLAGAPFVVSLGYARFASFLHVLSPPTSSQTLCRNLALLQALRDVVEVPLLQVLRHFVETSP